MARKSRRNLVEEQVIFSLREYRFGSYARLSVRSNKIKNDDSISHQLQRKRGIYKQESVRKYSDR